MTSHSRAYSMVLVTLFFLLPSVTRAATLGLSPANVSVDVGISFTETVMVSSADQALNAVSGTLSFPADLLQVVSVSKASSILSLWVAEPTFSNTDGTISFSGIVPNPGYIGSSGRVFSIQFRAKRTGTATIVFSSSSQILANDGNGTDILIGTQPSTITVSAPVTTTTPPPASVPTRVSPSSALGTDLVAHITSSTHPDQTQWYNLSHAIFDWTNAQGVSAIRLGYDTDIDGKPNVLYGDPISHKELDLIDGVWYFHVQEKSSSGWGPVSTYKVQIDTVPPLPFPVTFLNGTTTVKVGSTIAIQFFARDELSGMGHYQIAINGKGLAVSAEEGSKPYAISGDVGTHTLTVQAYDRAGNVTTSVGEVFSVIGAESTTPFLFTFGWLAINYFSLALIALAVLGTLLFGAWYIRVHFSAYRRRLNRQLGVTHTHIHKEFDTLKEVITEEILTLEQAKSRRSLTQEEERIVSRFKKLLDQAEQTIEKDLESLPR